MSFPAYPAYKESGVQWLGPVPSHWLVDRLKASVSNARNGIWGDEADGGDDDIACVRVADFNRQTLSVELNDPTMRKVTQRERFGRILQKGDLLLEKSGGGDGQPVGCVVLYNDEKPAVCSNFVARIELAEGMSPSYWRYVHAAAYSIRLTTCSINQTSGIQNLDQAAYFNELVPYPPRTEQEEIARFLDHETVKIDALIHEKKRLIELLAEKKHAVISSAVTKGVDPLAPMRSSNVDWIGEVPADWDVFPISKISKKITNGFVGPTRDILVEAGVPYVQATHIKDGIVRFGGEYFVRESWSQRHAKSILEEGDVLIVQTGAGTGDVGLVGLGEVGFNCHALIIVAPDRGRLYGRFLRDVLSSAYGQAMLSSIQTGAMHPHLNCGEVKFVPIPFPPLDEQIQISEFIRKASEKFDELSAQAMRGIETLKERRVALISAAVTGKIDVRGFAASPQ